MSSEAEDRWVSMTMAEAAALGAGNHYICSYGVRNCPICLIHVLHAAGLVDAGWGDFGPSAGPGEMKQVFAEHASDAAKALYADLVAEAESLETVYSGGRGILIIENVFRAYYRVRIAPMGEAEAALRAANEMDSVLDALKTHQHGPHCGHPQEPVTLDSMLEEASCR